MAVVLAGFAKCSYSDDMNTAVRILLLSLVAALTLACGGQGAGPNATPREAAVVIMGERLADDNETIERFPACMGLAVAPMLVVTSDHCAQGQFTRKHLVVDYWNWYNTTSPGVIADTGTVQGETRFLVPRLPLLSWLTVGAAADGPASVIVVRGSEIEQFPIWLEGSEFNGAIDHGDSGAPVIQGDAGVGAVHRCISSNDKDCDMNRARFGALPALP